MQIGAERFEEMVEGMGEVAPAKMSRRSREKLRSDKLYREEQGMQTSNGPEVAGLVENELGVAETETAPRPWRVSSGQREHEKTDLAACPWRVQPRRKQRRGAGAVQETVPDTVETVEEVAS